MIEIKVTLDLQGLPDAIHHLADAIALRVDSTPIEAVTPAKVAEAIAEAVSEPVSDSPAAKRITRRSKSKANVDVAPVAEPVPEVAPAAAEVEPEVAEPVEEKSYTLEQISKAGIDLMDRGLINDLMALLDKHGIPNLTAASPDKYAAIAEDLIALGATIPGGDA